MKNVQKTVKEITVVIEEYKNKADTTIKKRMVQRASERWQEMKVGFDEFKASMNQVNNYVSRARNTLYILI